MDIGGIDILVYGDIALDMATRLIVKQWPNAVYENAITGDFYDAYENVPFVKIKELFVYKDKSIFDLWESNVDLCTVLASENNMMIYLLKGVDYLSLVCDERDDFINGIVESLNCPLV